MRVNLTDGNWAELREVDDLYDADRKAVSRKAVMEYNEETRTRVMRGDVDGEMADALLERIVDSWSFPFKIPGKDPDAMGRLKIGQARELRAALSPYFKVINGTADSGDDTDPMDPTESAT